MGEDVKPLEVEDLRRIRLEPGETLAIVLAHEPTPAIAARIRDVVIRELGPDVGILVFGPGTSLVAVRPAEERPDEYQARTFRSPR